LAHRNDDQNATRVGAGVYAASLIVVKVGLDVETFLQVIHLYTVELQLTAIARLPDGHPHLGGEVRRR